VQTQNGVPACHNEGDNTICVPDATMQYRFYGLTDAGSVRSNNEDALAINADQGIVVLADGMGGYNAGEVASGMATGLLHNALAGWLTTGDHLVPQHIVSKLQFFTEQVNRAILNAASAHSQCAGMGTTLVVGVFRGSHLVLGHIGDSRCYRLRDGRLEQITKDHSFLQEQVDAGLLTSAQAAVAPGRHLLTRALGVETDIRLEIHTHIVQEDDLYLMCSDGLNDMVSDAEIAAILDGKPDLARQADALVRQAIAHGGRDNVSVVLIWVQPQTLGAA